MGDYEESDDDEIPETGDDNILLKAWTGISDNTRNFSKKVVKALPFKLPFATPCLADAPRPTRRTSNLPKPQPTMVFKYFPISTRIKIELKFFLACSCCFKFCGFKRGNCYSSNVLEL